MIDQNDDEKTSELRQRAEQKLQEQFVNGAEFSLEDAKKLIYELHVHQIELGLQNEELRSTQLALETSRHKYSDLYEFSPIGLLTLDNEEHIQEANLTFVKMMGIDREKLIKRHLSDFIDRSAQDTYHFFYQALRRTQKPKQCEILLLPVSYPPLVVRLDSIVLVQAGAEGTQTTYRIAVSDITDRHQADLEIKRLYIAEQEARARADYIVRRLSSLQQIMEGLSSALSYEQVSETCLRQSIPIIGAHGGDIMLLSNDGSTLQLRGSYGVSERSLSLPTVSSNPFTEVLHQQKPIWIESLDDYIGRYPESTPTPLDDSKALANLPLIVNEKTIGILSYGFSTPQIFTEEDQSFMEALAHQCAQALERVRLSEQAQSTVALQVRQGLARDLHDSVKQSLFAATMMSEALPNLWERNPVRGKEYLAQIITLNRAALAQMQVLLLELRPESILKTPFSVLLRQLSETVRGQRDISAELEMVGEEPTLPADVHIAIYRIAQESVNNLLKHSQATRFTIQLLSEPEQLTLVIRDNGGGFDATHSSTGMGMDTMLERAEAIHAVLHIASSASTGTEVKLLWKPPVSVSI
jgi:PAS domain S-box-containing protein